MSQKTASGIDAGAARKLCLDPDRLLNIRKVIEQDTAKGLYDGAVYIIARNGTIVVHDLPASVNEVNMSGSLLGMEFLRRLKSWHVEGDRITLTY